MLPHFQSPLLSRLVVEVQENAHLDQPTWRLLKQAGIHDMAAAASLLPARERDRLARAISPELAERLARAEDVVDAACDCSLAARRAREHVERYPGARTAGTVDEAVAAIKNTELAEMAMSSFKCRGCKRWRSVLTECGDTVRGGGWCQECYAAPQPTPHRYFCPYGCELGTTRADGSPANGKNCGAHGWAPWIRMDAPPTKELTELLDRMGANIRSFQARAKLPQTAWDAPESPPEPPGGIP
jgi:hypothetical protein